MKNSKRRNVVLSISVVLLCFQNCGFAGPKQVIVGPRITELAEISTTNLPETAATSTSSNGGIAGTNNSTPSSPTPKPGNQNPPKLIWRGAITGSYAGYAQDNSKIHVPVGWGYMDPMILTKDGNQYAITMSACDAIDSVTYGRTYCLSVIRNGYEVVSQSLSMANTIHGLADYAYQTPILFTYGGEIHVAYWAQVGGKSTINIASASFGASYPWPWQLRGSFSSIEGTSTNYLGGAIGPDGTLVLTSITTEGESRRLDIFSSAFPYTQINASGSVATFSSAHWSPLYSHVTVAANGTIEILTTLANGTNCSETGVSYTAYKNVVQYRGTLSGGFIGAWSDGASDVALNPESNGDNCYFNNSRFPLDLFHDQSTATTYSIYKASDLDKLNAQGKFASNGSYKSKIKLVSSKGGLLVDDLGKYFTNFKSSVDIDAVSMTKLSTGEFVFIANNRAATLLNLANHLNIVTTKDFKIFSATWVYSTPFGPGHSVKVAQPYKNGGDLSPHLDFFHGGDLYNPSGVIQYNQFNYYRFSF